MLRFLQSIELASKKSCMRNYLHVQALSTVRAKRSSRQQASESRVHHNYRGIHHTSRCHNGPGTSLCRPRPRLLHINRFSGNDGTTDNTECNNSDSEFNFGDCKSQPAEGKTLRWGIAPVSLMADDFAAALSVLPPNRHQIVSCAAAYRSHAVAFADKYHVKNVYTSFEDLAKCPNVDVVYISPLNPLHCELCHLMLNHDKHVLCEKPICMSESKAEKLLRKAQERGLFFMEGMWPRCVPAYHYLRHQILRNRLGDVQNVHCTLGLPLSQSKLALYGGVASDFGVYGIQLALWVFREVPEKVRATGKLNEENIDLVANIELSFSQNRWANIEVSAVEKLSNKAVVQGKEGCVKMSNYWCPTRLIAEGKDYEFPLPGGEQVVTHYHNRLGMCYEAEEVRNCILNGNTQSELFNHNESRLVANLMDSIHAQLRVGRSPEVYTNFQLENDLKKATEIVNEADASEALNPKIEKKDTGA